MQVSSPLQKAAKENTKNYHPYTHEDDGVVFFVPYLYL